jgi:hypothetical protein
MVVDAAVAPTCTATGLTEGSHCTRCDHKVEQNVVDALGHDMVVDAAVAPTCTATGLTEGSHCTRCDHKVEQNVVDALGHNFEEGVCGVCGAEDPDYVPAHKHNFVEGKCECGETDPDYKVVDDTTPLDKFWDILVKIIRFIIDFFKKMLLAEA